MKGLRHMEKQQGTIAKQFDETRFTKIDIIKNKRSSAFYLNFLPEQHMKRHAHPGRELYLHVMKGMLTLFIDEKTVELVTGNVIYFDEEEKLVFTNTGSNPTAIHGVMTKVD